jgi:hypothetical protein
MIIYVSICIELIGLASTYERKHETFDFLSPANFYMVIFECPIFPQDISPTSLKLRQSVLYVDPFAVTPGICGSLVCLTAFTNCTHHFSSPGSESGELDQCLVLSWRHLLDRTEYLHTIIVRKSGLLPL